MYKSQDRRKPTNDTFVYDRTDVTIKLFPVLDGKRRIGFICHLANYFTNGSGESLHEITKAVESGAFQVYFVSSERRSLLCHGGNAGRFGSCCCKCTKVRI